MMSLTSYKYDIFLSHNRADEDWTARLAERLEKEDWQERKLRVFFSPWDIRPGQSIPKRIEEALLKSRKVGLIMSPDSIASAWVELERLVTTYLSVSDRDERLLPLMRRDCEIPALIKHVLYVDFKDDAQFEENYKKLLVVIKEEALPRVARKQEERSNVTLPAAIPRPPAVGFVARRDANGHNIVESLKEELAPEKNQLVVLWGAGGVGKTTLAAEAAQGLSGVFGRRMVWASPELRADFAFTTLLDEIATQLGRAELRESKPDVKEEQVRALLAEAHTLVVLDNFETIKTDEQARCAKWLKQGAPCPALITTRQRVDRAHNISIDAMSPEEAKEFAERWIKREAHSPRAFEGVELDRIIDTAGRNPLVMQWVLARIDLAGEPGEVLEELMQGEGDAAQRVFDGSFNLPQLGDDGRDALLALSLFVPDASRDALSEAAGFGSNGKKRLNEAVTRLSSLWLVETTGGNKRLKIEGLTRELAKNRLSRDARADEFRQRFVAYFVSYVEAHSQPTPEDFDELEAEKGNALSAMDVAFKSEDWNSTIQIRFALEEFLDVRGYWDEAIRSGEYGLEAARNSTSDRTVAALAHNLAVMNQRRGELTEARRLYDESLEIKKKLGNQSGIAISLHELGRLAQAQGELEEARRLYDESLEIEKKLGNQKGIAITLSELGRLAKNQGDLAEARRFYNESLEINEKLGDRRVIAITLHALGVLAVSQGDLEEARRLYNESLEATKKFGDKGNIALIYHNLGLLEEQENNREEAARLFREALSIFEKLRSPNAVVARRSLERMESEDS
ncbi:MAG: tetratricopeptide repeat protein [Pyrinomonadaceae bacterium]